MSDISFSYIDEFEYDQLLLRVKNDPKIEQLIKNIDKDHQLAGAGILYRDTKGMIVMVRPFKVVCRVNPIHIVLYEVPKGESAQKTAVRLRDGERESKLIGEGIGALLSCGAAVLGWVVVLGSAGAAPISGGTSAAITVLSYSVATASAAQCVNGLTRTALEVTNPELLDLLDSKDWYTNISLALDAISIAGAAAASLGIIKAFKVLQSSSGRSTRELLKGMTRHERKRLTEEVLRLNSPGMSNGYLKELVRAGIKPARYSNSQINTALMLKVKDAIGASMSFTGSAMSGIVNGLVVGVYEAID